MTNFETTIHYPNTSTEHRRHDWVRLRRQLEEFGLDNPSAEQDDKNPDTYHVTGTPSKFGLDVKGIGEAIARRKHLGKVLF